MARSAKRNFKGMSYSELQRANSQNRNKLTQEDQKWLKTNGYKNVGWDNAIKLYEKVEDLLDKAKFEDLSLEELFLEADRVGNKYLTFEEIADFNQQMAQEVAEIGALVDQQFPDTKIEIIDYSQAASQKVQKQRHHKTYRTTKL